MSDQTTTNKNVVKRMFGEVVNEGRLDLVDELFDPEFQTETPQGLLDREGFKAFVTGWREAFADLVCTVSDLVAEDDAVAWRVRCAGTHTGDFNGIPATGRRVSFDSLNTGRFRDGKAIQHTVLMDIMTLMTQLGVVPEGASA